MRFLFDSFVSMFQRRQQAVAKLFRPDTRPCETVFISYQSNDDLHCHYEFKLPAPIAVNITFSNGRHIRVNSEGKYEESSLECHVKELYSMWTEADEAWLQGMVEQHKKASQVSA